MSSIGTSYIIYLDPVNVELYVTHAGHMLWTVVDSKHTFSCKSNTFLGVLLEALYKLSGK